MAMVITATPLRFSLVGGGSDLPQYWKYGPGRIISMTLDCHIYVTLSLRDSYSGGTPVHDSRIRLSYTKTENVDRLEDIQHDIVRETFLYLRENDAWDDKPFEMTTIGDVPARGAGLGTSSALTVGILKAALPHCGRHWIAQHAAAIEMYTLRRRIGVQDHLSATLGGLRYYEICAGEGDDTYSLKHNRPFEETFGIRLADHLLAFRLPADKSAEAESAEAHKTLDGMVDEMEKRAPAIRVTCATLIKPMLKAIYELDFKSVGMIMDEAWLLKKESHAIVDTNIDRWYNTGLDAGAYGGKVSGSVSGGAGHLFFVCDPVNHDAVREALKGELAEMRVGYWHFGSLRYEM